MRINIDAILEQQGKTKYWLAKETGISNNAICNLCNNKTTSISFEAIDLICKALSCTPNDIFIISE